MNNLEFINQAQKILTDDYNIRRTTEYSNWLLHHKNAWTQPHTIIPFPPFVISAGIAPFKASVVAPNEKDIASKALELYNQYRASQSASEVQTNQNESVPSSVTPVVVPEQTETIQVASVSLDEQTESNEVTTPIPVDTVYTELPAETIDTETETPVSQEPVPVKVQNQYADGIYKIFQTSTESASTESQLNDIPQPAEELAKLDQKERAKPTFLQRLQNITARSSSTN